MPDAGGEGHDPHPASSWRPWPPSSRNSSDSCSLSKTPPERHDPSIRPTITANHVRSWSLVERIEYLDHGFDRLIP